MDTTTIHQEILIGATPEAVYEVYLDAKTHSAFTGSKATSNPIEGGEFTSWNGYALGKYVKLVKGKKIVQEWITTEWPEDADPSTLTITLFPSNGGTLLKMVHSNVPHEQAEGYAKGWKEYYWEPMKKYFLGRKKS